MDEVARNKDSVSVSEKQVELLNEDLETSLSECVEHNKSRPIAKYFLHNCNEEKPYVKSNLSDSVHDQLNKTLQKDINKNFDNSEKSNYTPPSMSVSISNLSSHVKNGPSQSSQSHSDLNGITNESMRHAGIGRGKRRTLNSFSSSAENLACTDQAIGDSHRINSPDFTRYKRNFKTVNSNQSVSHAVNSTVGSVNDSSYKNIKNEHAGSFSKSGSTSVEAQGCTSEITPTNASCNSETGSTRDGDSSRPYISESYNRGQRTRPPRTNRFYKNTYPNAYRNVGEKTLDPRFSWQSGPRHTAANKAQDFTYSRHDYRRNHSGFRQPMYEKTYSKVDAVNIEKKSSDCDINGSFSSENTMHVKKLNRGYSQNSLSNESYRAMRDHAYSTANAQKNKFPSNSSPEVTGSQTSYPQLCSSSTIYTTTVTVSSQQNCVFTASNNRNHSNTVVEKTAVETVHSENVQNVAKSTSSCSSSENHVNTDYPLVPNEAKSAVMSCGVHSEKNEYTVESVEASLKNRVESSEKLDFSKKEVSSFVRDFYAVTDIEPPCEEEFRLVKNKQRKRQQKKESQVPGSESKSATPEVPNRTQPTSKVGKMLFSTLSSGHGNEQIKLDSNCNKSIQNPVSSEQSSAENSDLESVHCTSVSGDADYANSSLSSAIPCVPHASYADAIRMPITTVNKTSLNNQICSTVENDNRSSDAILACPENVLQERLVHRDASAQHAGSSEWIISRLSQLTVSSSSALGVNGILHPSTPNGQDFVNPRPIVVSLEKPSFYNSSLQTNKTVSTFVHSTNLSPDRKGMEGINLNCSCVISANSAGVRFTYPIVPCVQLSSSVSSEPVTSIVDSVGGVGIDCACYSTNITNTLSCDGKNSVSAQGGHCLDNTTNPPAVIIMDNCKPSGNVSDISFGIEFDEIVKLCSDSGTTDFSKDTVQLPLKSSDECHSLSKTEDANLSVGHEIAEGTAECTSSLSSASASDSDASLVVIGGKKFHWKESRVSTVSTNMLHVVNMLSESWNLVEKDFKKENEETSKAKVKYYSAE